MKNTTCGGDGNNGTYSTTLNVLNPTQTERASCPPTSALPAQCPPDCTCSYHCLHTTFCATAAKHTLNVLSPAQTEVAGLFERLREGNTRDPRSCAQRYSACSAACYRSGDSVWRSISGTTDIRALPSWRRRQITSLPPTSALASMVSAWLQATATTVFACPFNAKT